MSKVKKFICECGEILERDLTCKANKLQYSWWRRAYKSYCCELDKDVWCKEVGDE
jgi:hypothetical protein